MDVEPSAVVGQVDRGHAAFAELTLDGIAALQGGVQAGGRVVEIRGWTAALRVYSAERV